MSYLGDLKRGGDPWGSGFRVLHQGSIGVPYFGVLIIRILLFRVLYLGPLFSDAGRWAPGPLREKKAGCPRSGSRRAADNFQVYKAEIDPLQEPRVCYSFQTSTSQAKQGT